MISSSSRIRERLDAHQISAVGAVLDARPALAAAALAKAMTS